MPLSEEQRLKRNEWFREYRKKRKSDRVCMNCGHPLQDGDESRCTECRKAKCLRKRADSPQCVKRRLEGAVIRAALAWYECENDHTVTALIKTIRSLKKITETERTTE